MEQLFRWLREIPTPGLVALSSLAAVQIALQVYALIDLAKRESVLYQRKWIWLLVIVMGNLLGAVLYLAVARKVEPSADVAAELATARPAGRETADRAMRTVYGNEDEGNEDEQ